MRTREFADLLLQRYADILDRRFDLVMRQRDERRKQGMQATYSRLQLVSSATENLKPFVACALCSGHQIRNFPRSELTQFMYENKSRLDKIIHNAVRLWSTDSAKSLTQAA